MKQGCCGGDVLTCPSEVRKGFTIGDDPSVHVMGHGVCMPTISAAFDLLIDLHVLSNKLLPGFVYFPLSGSQLLHPYVRWGRCPPLVLPSRLPAGVVSSAETLLTCPSGVPAMKHSREG